jgi:hypothetical protein
MSANATRIDDLPGGDMGGGSVMMPVGSLPMPGGPTPALPNALQPISTSVHEQNMMSQSTFPQQPQMGGTATVYNPNPFGQAPMSQPMTGPMSSDTINQIMSTINVAGNHLPSRDIPMMNPHDDQSRPNYIPGGGNGGDYIQQYSDFSEMARRNNHDEGKQSGDLFDRLQIPLMCAVIFFLFQLPIVRKSLFKYLPSLYFTDGNPKISALLVQALVFGAGVYLLNTFTQ